MTLPTDPPLAAPAITGEAFERLIIEQVGIGADFRFHVVELRRGEALLHLPFSPAFLRPGQAISGPTQFTLADTALYAAVLSEIGMVPLAVTTEMSLHFLRKATAEDLWAVARLIKSGRRLAVGRVELYSGPSSAAALASPPVSMATGTYSLP